MQQREIANFRVTLTDATAIAQIGKQLGEIIIKTGRSMKSVVAGLAILVTSAVVSGATRLAVPIAGTRTAGFFDSIYAKEARGATPRR